MKKYEVTLMVRREYVTYIDAPNEKEAVARVKGDYENEDGVHEFTLTDNYIDSVDVEEEE